MKDKLLIHLSAVSKPVLFDLKYVFQIVHVYEINYKFIFLLYLSQCCLKDHIFLFPKIVHVVPTPVS